MKDSIGIIGHFGGSEHFLDGQTVKTKILYDELTAHGIRYITCVDTYYNKVNKAKLLFDSLRCILKCKTIIVLLSGNGMKVFFPMMYWAKKLFRRCIYHDVIGGNLSEYVKKKPTYKKYLSSFDDNWVEFERLKQQLSEVGVHNCTVIPNFKRLNTQAAKMQPTEEGKRSFCVFSRVMKEKGIAEAIEAVQKYNDEHMEKVSLNIWGPIDERFADEFATLKSTENVHYRGCVDYDKSVETLTDHLALLFPTYWEGEGFPGTIVDAYAAALPVIASDWNANSELIEDFVSGWVYPNEKVKSLYMSIVWAIDNTNKMLEMRNHAYAKAKEFMPDKWLDVITEKIHNK